MTARPISSSPSASLVRGAAGLRRAPGRRRDRRADASSPTSMENFFSSSISSTRTGA